MQTENDNDAARAAGVQDGAWRDPTLPVADRVAALLAEMTLEEKVSQLYAAWVGIDPDHDNVAPLQHELVDASIDFDELTRFGLGQLTRPFGTAAVDPVDGAKAVARLQADVVAANRFGIPAVVHEECLTGFMTWRATIYPTPLAWGAAFDPALVERMAAQIGASMHTVGVHQGLAPVLDVTRDPRWGRTEETIGEDPYLVGTIGTAYVRGLQSAGVIATLKHFVGYSASTGARNFGPVSVGPRELQDILLPPFEMAIRDGGADSVMPAYVAIDGVPASADGTNLTGLLRDTWGFTGTVVADYFGVSFLELKHCVAGSKAEAGAMALAAGMDVELPSVRCYGEPLLAAVRSGLVPESLVDRAAARVLEQKCRLGLLDPEWVPVPALQGPNGAPDVDLDPPEARQLARTLAEESLILLSNDGTLPLGPQPGRVAVVGPLADDPAAMLGCYTFPCHAGRNSISGDEGPTELGPLGVEIPTVLAALREELPEAVLTHVPGCAVADTDVSGVAAAVEAAAGADVCIAVLGDHAGLFGRGTSGEGCDAEHLGLPGVQEQLLEALLGTGTPVVLVLMTGRPYALGAFADRLAAIVQGFFPGEEGGPAVAGVLSGRVTPSGRLPIGVPRIPERPPANYLSPLLGHETEVSNIDPSPLFPFGHGLSYTTFAWEDAKVDQTQVATDGVATVSVRIRNTGDRPGTEVVQLYLHDPVAQVTRPVVKLIGYARVPLEPGQSREVTMRVSADLTSFTGRLGQRVVEPGELELRLGASCTDIRHTLPIELVGPERVVDHRRALTAEVSVA